MHTELLGVAALSIAHALLQSVHDLPRALVEALCSMCLAVGEFDLHLGRRVPVTRRVARIHSISAADSHPVSCDSKLQVAAWLSGSQCF